MKQLVLTPIGSCRITSPLQQAQQQYPVRINRNRIYGYTHSSAEALQQVRFLRGEYMPPRRVWPVLAPNDRILKLDRQAHPAADIYFVEIASAKVLAAGDDCVQLNYVAAHFRDFFADRTRARTYWSMSTPARLERRIEWLEQDPVYRRYNRVDRALLRSITRRLADRAGLRTDMLAIMDLLDRVVFVTHCNARMADGNPIPSRDCLIADLHAVAGEIGAAIFDPTAAMREFGQLAAFAGQGRNLTHYTPDFERRLFADLYRQHIATGIGLRGVSTALAAGEHIAAPGQVGSSRERRSCG